MDFVFHSAKKALVQFVPSSTVGEAEVRIISYFNMDLHIMPWRNNTKVLARLAMVSNTTVSPKIFDNRIGGFLLETRTELTEIFSDIGDISER